MNTSYTYQDSLHLLNNNEWNKLSVQDRAAVMQSIENEVARRDGRQPCNVSLFSKAPDDKGRITAGNYSPNDGSIRINAHYLQNGPREGNLNTILHEGRHAYQDKAVKGEINHHNKAEVKAWQDNMKPGHYISGEKNIRAYYRQPIEADAHNHAEITTGQILAEQKIQNYTNKGINSFMEKSNAQSAIVQNKGIESARQKMAEKKSDLNTNKSINQGISSFQSKRNGQPSNTPAISMSGVEKSSDPNANSTKSNGSGQGR